MATKDQTTAFVVAMPTPFAPSFAAIPQEQLIKLMTLGLTEQEAEEQIIKGFLH